MFLFCNLPAKVQSLYRNCPIRHHLLYFFYHITPFRLPMQGCAAIKQCSCMLKAMLLGAGSNAFRCWEHCFQALGAMLLASQSNALGSQKQCPTAFKAMIQAQERPASIIRKQAFLRFSNLPLGATGVGLYLPPLGATTLARDSPPSEGPGEVALPPYWGGLGWGFTSPPPSSH